MEFFNGQRCNRLGNTAFVLVVIGVFTNANAETDVDELITVEMSAQSVKLKSSVPIVESHWSLHVDHEDVTALATLDASRTAIQIKRDSSTGEHRVVFRVTTDDGYDRRGQRNFYIAAPQYGGYAALTSEIGVAPYRPNAAISNQNYYVAADMYNESHWQKENWQSRLRVQANAADRGVDDDIFRDRRLYIPEIELETSRQFDQRRATLALGDQIVNATPFVATQLARRGGQIGISSPSWNLGIFSLTGDPVLSLEQGTGLSVERDRNLQVAIGEYRWADASYRLRGVYLGGGRKNDSLSTAGNAAPSHGNTAGVLFAMNPFARDATIEMEVGQSTVDRDTTDAITVIPANAIGLRLYGSESNWRYRVSVERIGDGYGSLGNDFLLDDRLTAKIETSFAKEGHSTQFRIGSSYDNIANRSEEPRMATQTISGDYGYIGFSYIRIRLYAAMRTLASSREPAGIVPQKVSTREAFLQVTPHYGPWEIGLSSRWSVQDDQYGSMNDTRIRMFGFAPGYRQNNLFLASVLTLTTADASPGGQQLFAASLLLSGDLLRRRIEYQWQVNGNVSRGASDTNRIYFYSDAGLGYRLNDLWKTDYRPLVGVRCKYGYGVYPLFGDDRGWIAWLTFSLNMPSVY